MTHRSFKHHNNRYEVVVQGFVADEDIEALKIGAGQVSAEFDVLTGAVAAPVNQPSYQRKYNKHTNKMVRLPPTIVKIIDCDRKAGLTLLEVSMEELLPQQMQRMCVQVLKCPMLSIKRTEFGPIRLAGLKRAQWSAHFVAHLSPPPLPSRLLPHLPVNNWLLCLFFSS